MGRYRWGWRGGGQAEAVERDQNPDRRKQGGRVQGKGCAAASQQRSYPGVFLRVGDLLKEGLRSQRT